MNEKLINKSKYYILYENFVILLKNMQIFLKINLSEPNLQTEEKYA